MKESDNKTASRSQSGQNKNDEKMSRSSASTRGTASTRSNTTTNRSSSRTGHVNNPEGHNQYTKK